MLEHKNIIELKKEYLLLGFDFKDVKIRENLYLLYDLNNFVVIKNHYSKPSNLERSPATHLILRQENILDIQSLSNIEFKNLKSFYLSSNNIEDIFPLSTMVIPNLITLSLYQNDIEDVTPLFDLKNLFLLDLQRNKKITQKQTKQLKEQLPNCTIYTDYYPYVL